MTYVADCEIQSDLLGDADMELYSAAQVTDMLEAYFVRFADDAAEVYLDEV